MTHSATTVDLFIRIGIVVWLGTCAYYDTRTGEIPNTLTLPGLVLGGVLAGLEGWQNLAFYGIVLLLLFALNFSGSMGGADAKILGALAGLWPLGLMTILFGLVFWIVSRRLLGRRGNFRAGLPIALAAAATLLVDGVLNFL